MFWIPALVTGGVLATYHVVKKRRHGMTPERKTIFERAYQTLQDPVKLRKLADEFEKYGCKHQAQLLRKRAALREMPEELKAARRVAFKKGMNSKDPVAVEKLAAVYEKEGALGSASELRKHAIALRKAA